LLAGTPAASSGIGTTIPISVELASAMSGSLFPVALDLEPSRVFLTRPQLAFLDEHRIGLSARFQIYDHRPELGIALSETGQVFVSGKLDYDSGEKKIVLHQPRLETLEFDRSNEASAQFTRDINGAWSSLISDPIRSEIPPHPYLSPFKDYVQGIGYDGQAIYLLISTSASP